MTIKLILAASVAALAISAPAAARPGGNVARERVANVRDTSQRVDRMAQRVERQQVRVDRAPRIDRAARLDTRLADRQMTRPARIERAQARSADRQFVRPTRVERTQARVADRQVARPERMQKMQPPMVDRQQLRADRQQLRADRQASALSLHADRQQLRTDRLGQTQALKAERIQLRADNVARVRALAADRALVRPVTTFGTTVLPAAAAQTLIGVPLATASTITTLSPLPTQIQYLYPDTSDYYYRYGDGYLYQVDRNTSLISALLPLLFGGYMPGQYLPTSYMNSYVPNYYGLNSFYPSSFDYGYGSQYNNLCNRYANGMVYQVDCATGMIVDVVPLYAGGYGVGQMLPSAYYNVPNQYRDLYSDTSDYGYYYAPGAIYQYDQRSSLITSVAALLSPGFGIGQPLPMGYSAYNVPYGYRDTYYDTPNAWYRYNNGYIYQVDPTTQLVTAIVASILT